MVSALNAHGTFRCSGKASLIATCLLSLLSAPDLSFAQGAQDVCPRGYSIFQTVCLNESTGDVVNQFRKSEAGGVPSPVPNPDKAPAPAKSGG